MTRNAGRRRRSLRVVLTAIVAVWMTAYGSPDVCGHAVADPAVDETPQAQRGYPDTPGHRAFAEALRLLNLRQYDGAAERFTAALAYALDTRNQSLEAGCHRGLGAIAHDQGRYADALDEHRRSRALFLAIGDQANAARGHQDVGVALFWLGRRDEARTAWDEALSTFVALGDQAAQASVLRNLVFLSRNATERSGLIERGLSLARSVGDLLAIAELLSSRSDAAFTAGDYRAAFDDAVAAVEALLGAGARARVALARSFTSLGRIYRVHAQHDLALAAYQRALAIQHDAGDLQGYAQTARTIAAAYETLGQVAMRRRYLDMSLDAIRRTDAIDERRLTELSLAMCLADLGDSEGARHLLGIDATHDDTGHYWAQHAAAYVEVVGGRATLALEPATRAVALARGMQDAERLLYSLWVRARAQAALGRHEDAYADASEALDVIESLRARLVPNDYMKRGFMDRFTELFGIALEALDTLQRPADAMAVAERARARAFTDLLVARRAQRQPSPLPAAAVLTGSVASPASHTREAPGQLATRGTTSRQLPRSADDLPSGAAVPPATMADMRRIARERDISILSYWVGPSITRAWLLSPDGEVLSARVDIDDRRLEALVATLWRAPRGADSVRAARALHRLVVERLLPSSPPASLRRVLIVPHGPLAALSFAALRDARGRYLVEDYALSYAPAVSVVTSGGGATGCCPGATRLLVGSPNVLPQAAATERLQRLPGARRELAAVGIALGPGHVVTLEGRTASEANLRRQVGAAGIVHVATHGVMHDEAPLDSYLALDATSIDHGGPEDGRLTAREIYDLELHADLVVLSACRSGLGKASGDGLLGLSRAFFYAGARHVVATLWDVADEPAARLMPAFYRALAVHADPSLALREAQVALLTDLRRGRVVVRGHRGAVPLPDHPALWASFVVMGLPS